MTRRSRTILSASWKRRSSCPTRATLPSRRPRRTRPSRSLASPEPQPDGSVRHRPFHSYTMKQAIDEGFILDVLKYYTPVDSYYRLVKTIDHRPRVRHEARHPQAAALCRKPRRARSGSRPRSWSTTSTTGRSAFARSTARRAPWSSPAASSARFSTTERSAHTWQSERARTGRSSPFRASTSLPERG